MTDALTSAEADTLFHSPKLHAVSKQDAVSPHSPSHPQHENSLPNPTELWC